MVEKRAHVQIKRRSKSHFLLQEFFSPLLSFSRRQRFPECGAQQWVRRRGGCKETHPQNPNTNRPSRPRKAAANTVNKQDSGRMSPKICLQGLL